MTLIGNGVYTYREAGHLLGLNSSTIRRWTEGYRHSTTRAKMEPLFEGSYENVDGVHAVSFLDLVEMLFIKAFTEKGVRIRTIRKALDQAKKLLHWDHPFAMKKLYTDGKAIFAEIVRSSDDSELLDLIKDQYQMPEIVLPTLLKTLDFDEAEMAHRWWPNGKDGGIVVDPERHFGKPVVDRINMSTEVIYAMYRAGRSIEEIEYWYEVDKASITLAIEFEKSLVA